MEFFSGASTGPTFGASTLPNLVNGLGLDLPPYAQKHIANVYTTLAGGFATAVLGSMMYASFGLGGFGTTLLAIGAMIWLAATPNTAENLQQRTLLFHGFTFLKGASLGPLIDTVAFLAPGTVTTALVGTAIVFACFSISALTAKRRSWLFLVGGLSSAVSLLVMLSFFNLFFGMGATTSFQLYLGLMVFCGYVLVDTQVIMEKAIAGDTDHIQGAVTLFIDAVAIFVRLLIILAKNSGKNDRRDRRRR